MALNLRSIYRRVLLGRPPGEGMDARSSLARILRAGFMGLEALIFPGSGLIERFVRRAPFWRHAARVGADECSEDLRRS